MSEDKIRNISICTLVEESNASRRLLNGIARAEKANWMPFRTVGEYLNAGNFARGRMMRVPDIGQKSATELDTLIKDFIQDTEVCLNITEKRGEAESNAEKRYLSEHGNLVDGRVTLEDFLHEALEALKERERQVIIARCGLNGNPIKTLEVIGREHNLTRERIRQIERRAIRKLKSKKRANAIRLYVNDRKQEIYEKLAGGKRIIPFKRLSRHEAMLSGEYRLALKIAYGSVRQWLESVAESTSLGWHIFPYASEDINAWKERVDKYRGETSFPRSITSMAESLGLTRDQIETAVELTRGYKVFSGYLVKGNATPRQRRCVQLHLLMSCVLDGRPAAIEEVLRKYHSYYPSDLCSVRDLDIVLRSSPHLFVNLNESGWVSIGATSPIPTSKVTDHAEAGHPFLPVTDIGNNSEREETLFQTMHKMMEEEGPMALTAARDRFTEIAGDKYSPNSVFPVLVTNPAFVRMAPGVFGTKNQLKVLAPLRSVSSLLLRASQCKIYVLARAARKPRIEYPLWTPAMEHAWCKWADEQADKVLFQSLLSVVEPETWPVSDVESNWWLNRKEKEGRYQLKTNPLSLRKKVPVPDNLYAVLLYTRAKGAINWMVANRTTGCRIDDRHIVSTLALLVAIKALQAVGDWQECHEPGKSIDDVLMNFEKQRVKKGFVEWSAFDIDDTAAEFNCRETWVQHDEIRDLIHKIKSEEKLGENKTASVRVSNKETLDELLERHKQHQIEEQLRSYVNSEND